MFTYLIRRILYAFPVLIGVNILTFLLFFTVNTPDDMARAHLGDKYVTATSIAAWKAQRGYNYPTLVNTQAHGLKRWTQTLFFQKSISLLSFQLGRSDQGRSIAQDLRERMGPSLALAVPTLALGLITNIVFALLCVLFHGRPFDRISCAICIALMSISGLFYIIIGQHWVAKLFKWVPFSGYGSGWSAWKFLALPVIIGVISGLGAGTRWYRTIFLEAAHQEYIMTARAKGLGEGRILFRHLLPNGLIPILTGVVVIIPSLFMGSLVMESFFGIPGLGSYTIDAIAHQDFEVVRVMVFLGTVLYLIGLIATDIAYTWVDPRVKLS